jgi:hypothetical protein
MAVFLSTGKIILVGRIQIRIENADPDPEGQK